MRKSQLGLKTLAFRGRTQAALSPANAAPTHKQIPLDGGSWFNDIIANTKTRSLQAVCLLLLAMTTLGLTTPAAHAQGIKTGSWNWSVPNGATDFYSQGWTGGESPNNQKTSGTRTWSGTNTSFTGQGGWFNASWTASPNNNWIPDISRAGGASGPLNTMVPNYTISWTGNANITGGHYTFGLKFNLATQPGWTPYNMTNSYEAYIVTHTDETTHAGTFLGTVITPGDPVPYDCYVVDAYWDGGFKQLWAYRRINTWSGPVNVQAILKRWSDSRGPNTHSFDINTWQAPAGFSIAPETFSTSGSFQVENIRIPNLNTPLPVNLIANPSFDAENWDTQAPSGWSEWEGDANYNSITPTSSYTEAYGGSYIGARHLAHYKSSAYRIYTYQVKTGLATGYYTLRAYARRSGNQTACYLEAADYGSSTRTVNIPVSPTYQMIEIPNIYVSNGQSKIGFWSNANAGNWAYLDDVSFFRQ